jgi:hypothetical protein
VGETYSVLASARRSSIRIVREKRTLALDANSCVDANQIPRIRWDFDVTAGNSSLAPTIRARVVHALNATNERKVEQVVNFSDVKEPEALWR